MRAFALEGFGDAGSVRDLPLPEAGAGQIRVRVRAAGVNPVDWLMGMGVLKDMLEHRFPLVLGQDFSGAVDAVGPGVDAFRIGHEVFGVHGMPHAGAGTFAGFVVASTGTVTHRPASLTPVAAAALPLAGASALMSVDAVRPAPGDTVLIAGAAGGVGGCAVQLAVLRGARVIALTRAQNAEYVRGLGATEVIDYTTRDVVKAVRAAHPEGVAALLQAAGDAAALAGYAGAVRDGGGWPR